MFPLLVLFLFDTWPSVETSQIKTDHQIKTDVTNQNSTLVNGRGTTTLPTNQVSSPSVPRVVLAEDTSNVRDTSQKTVKTTEQRSYNKSFTKVFCIIRWFIIIHELQVRKQKSTCHEKKTSSYIWWPKLDSEVEDFFT